MKLEWKRLTVVVDSVDKIGYYLNTPTCVILSGPQPGDHVPVAGCNLTADAGFIPAPGFEGLKTQQARELRETISQQSQDLQELRDARAADMDALIIFKSKMDAIEAWASQPATNAMVRMTLAHLLKMVRGET
jgi:hypothetical protein